MDSHAAPSFLAILIYRLSLDHFRLGLIFIEESIILNDLKTDDALIAQAMEILSRRIRVADHLSSPNAVRDYLRLLLAGREHEVFVVVLLDAQNRVLICEELFRGTLTQTSVYPREIVKLALSANAAAAIFAHNHPSGVCEPSNADELLTGE